MSLNKTNIEWVRNPDGSPGYTFNPITGCLNHVNGMCKGGGFPCYAHKLANGRLKNRYLANKNLARWHEPTLGEYGFSALSRALSDPFYPRFWPERLELTGVKRPHTYGYMRQFNDHKPKGVFICDMSDLFGIGVPEEWTRRVLETISNPRLKQWRFYLLTKQPQNLIKFSPYPPNCWVGVTATSNNFFWRALSYLKDIKTKVKYLSLEPLLGKIIGLRSPYGNFETSISMRIPDALQLAGITWLIIGAQTKPNVYPKIEWVKEIVEACDRAGIPVFLKNNLWEIFPGNKIIPAWAQMEKVKYRQEMPK